MDRQTARQDRALSDPHVPAPLTNPQFSRYTAAELADMAAAPAPAAKVSAKKLEDVEWPEDPAEVWRVLSAAFPTH